ncbi:MAG: hypothetical protein K6F09_04450 [Clostridiales bacterium]|nr:hypothetical protein [Clostridiales bacterium]
MLKKKRTVSAVLAVIIFAALVLSCTGCVSFGKKPDALTVTGKMTEHFSTVTDKSIHLIDESRLQEPMAGSGLMRLYIDDNSFGVALLETSNRKRWYALPAASNANYDNSAATVTLDVIKGKDIYHLNSQDDSVKYKNVAVDVTTENNAINGFNVNYIITADATVASKVNKQGLANGSDKLGSFSSSDIAFLVTVSYALRDGNLYVGANWKNLSDNDEIKIENLGLLEFFGASDRAEEGDFILVPDGCGAAIKTAVIDNSFKPLSFKVYGDPDDSDVMRAVFPAYGAKQGEDAFAVIIESGDAIATINADRARGGSGFNTVGAKFNVTEKTVRDNVTYLSGESFDDEIRLCIRLLGGASADYDGMAAACREQFMRSKLISTDMVKETEYLPFNLSIIGSATGKSKLTDRLEAVNALTTFEEARDMLSRMKAKGINNINVRYEGVLDGGINQNKKNGVDIQRKLGGKSGFKDLLDYLRMQGTGFFLDISIMSWNSDRLLPFGCAKDLAGESRVIKRPNAIYGMMGPASYERDLLKLSRLERNVISYLTDSEKYKIDGYCVNDSDLLYSDSSKGFTNRQDASKIIAENISPLSTGRGLMIRNGNFYAIKNADVIIDLPLSPAAGERSGCYEAVPFVQMILHGTADYSGTPVNTADDVKRAMLRSVEYGACPSYEWYYEKIGEGGKYYYENQLNDAADFYTKANETLCELRDMRITGNYETQTSGVFCTEYENGSVIYVNYNGEEKMVSGITVEPNSFIKID